MPQRNVRSVWAVVLWQNLKLKGSVTVWLLFLAMHPGTLLFGLSQWFVELVLEAVPGIECEEEWNHSGNSYRNCDFFEVFSGRGALSAQMIRVAHLHY